MFDVTKCTVAGKKSGDKACEEEAVKKANSIRCKQENGFMQVWICDEFPGPWNNGYSAYLDVLTALRNADHDQEIHVNISSPGGYTVALSDLATEIKAFKHVVTIVTGFAASCGFLLMALGDEIYVSPSATLLFHSASMVIDGNTNAISAESEFLKKMWDQNVTEYGLDRILTKEELAEGYHSDIKFLGSELIKRRVVYPYEFYSQRIIPQTVKAYGVGKEVYVLCNGDYYIMQPVKNEKKTDDLYTDWFTLAHLTNPELIAYDKERDKLAKKSEPAKKSSKAPKATHRKPEEAPQDAPKPKKGK